MSATAADAARRRWRPAQRIPRCGAGPVVQQCLYEARESDTFVCCALSRPPHRACSLRFSCSLGLGGRRGRRRSVMSVYMSTFQYKPEVWSELISNPENRTETVSRLLENAGCKLKGLWYAFGQCDGFALTEAPNNVTGASLMIAMSASGAF